MDNPTLTPEAMTQFTELAEDAEAYIAGLPESSQPIWYRQRVQIIPA